MVHVNGTGSRLVNVAPAEGVPNAQAMQRAPDNKTWGLLIMENLFKVEFGQPCQMFDLFQCPPENTSV